jgi:hypothetical protein
MSDAQKLERWFNDTQSAPGRKHALDKKPNSTTDARVQSEREPPALCRFDAAMMINEAAV